MEREYSAYKASEFELEDFISNMPDDVTTNILDRLALQDAVRTGVLATNWRLKWTMLSKLVFDANFLNYLLDKDCKNEYGKIISRLLLHLNGAITKFVLVVDNSVNVEDINHWILCLSTSGIKDLTVYNGRDRVLKLPTRLFSCLKLTHLKLNDCILNPPESFHGFPNLLSLELRGVVFESGKFGEFFTQCPLLESLNLGFLCFTTGTNKVKLDEIAKLANLKRLSLFLCNLDNTCSSSRIFELMDSLPKLQELDLDFFGCKFTEDGAYKRLSTNFPFLKILKLSTLELSHDIMLSFSFEMISSFPNLQTLEISENNWQIDPAPAENCSLEVDYDTMGLKQLQRVVLINLKGSENEVCLIKCLLACSPFLKRIGIRPASFLKDKGKLMFAKKLLKFYQAYPVVNINVW